MPAAFVRLRAEGGPGVGMGHLARSSALATALRLRGVEVTTTAVGISPEELEIDGVRWGGAESEPGPGPSVIDGYGLTATVGADERPLFSMHEAWAPSAPERIGYLELGAEPEPSALVEPRYACLRRPFWALPAREVAERVGTVLVSSGGSDAATDSGALAAELAAALPGTRVVAVRGPFSGAGARPGVELLERPADLRAAMLEADLVVTAGGQTMLEAVATGAPTVAAALAPDQLPQARLLAAHDAVDLVAPERLVAAAVSLAADPDRRRALSARRRCIDGLGAHRIASVLIDRFGFATAFRGIGGLELRDAHPADSPFLLELRNDPEVRAASRNTEPVATAEHERWLAATLGDPDRRLFVVERDGSAVGQVRLDLGPDAAAEISVGLRPSARGSGTGAAAIRSATLLALTELDVATVTAAIRPENETSRLAFERAGYARADRLDPDRGLDIYELTAAGARLSD